MVYVFLADGFEEIEAMTTVDVLLRAEIDVETVSIMGRLPVRGAHCVEVVADILFEDAVFNKCEMLVLPGGMPGASNLDLHEGLREKILSFNNIGKRLAAICAAPLVFGRLGILEGKRATCYPGFEEDLEGANVVSDKVVTDKNITTSRGPGTAMAFALELIEVLKGKETRSRVAEGLLFTDS